MMLTFQFLHEVLQKQNQNYIHVYYVITRATLQKKNLPAKLFCQQFAFHEFATKKSALIRSVKHV